MAPRTRKTAGTEPAPEPTPEAAPAVGTVDSEKLADAHPLVGVAEAIDANPRTAYEQRAAIDDEYGTWVAVTGITHDGARAYNAGDAVPAANVERWGYADLGLVVKQGTKAAEAVTP